MMGEVSDPASDDSMPAHLLEAEERARGAEARIDELEAELARVRDWRRSALLAVVVVALLAILMLGIVAFNAVDDGTVAASL